MVNNLKKTSTYYLEVIHHLWKIPIKFCGELSMSFVACVKEGTCQQKWVKVQWS